MHAVRRGYDHYLHAHILRERANRIAYMPAISERASGLGLNRAQNIGARLSAPNVALLYRARRLSNEPRRSVIALCNAPRYDVRRQQAEIGVIRKGPAAHSRYPMQEIPGRRGDLADVFDAQRPNQIRGRALESARHDPFVFPLQAPCPRVRSRPLSLVFSRVYRASIEYPHVVALGIVVLQINLLIFPVLKQLRTFAWRTAYYGLSQSDARPQTPLAFAPTTPHGRLRAR